MARRLDQPAGTARTVAMLARSALPALLLAGVLGLAHAAGLSEWLGQERVDALMRGQGLTGWLLFVGLGAVSTAVAVPRQAVSLMGGYAFGFMGGGLLALVATGLGCVLGYSWGRLAGRAWLPWLGQRRLARLEALLRRDPFGVALCIRLMPVGNNALTNLLAGIGGAPLRPFLGGSLLGYAPQTLIFALLGSGIQVDPAWRVSLATLMLAAASLLGLRMFRKSVLGRELNLGTRV